MKNRTILGLMVVMMGLSAVALGGGKQMIPRISYVDGDVSLREGGRPDWSTVDVNLPVQQGDRLVLDRDGLVEIEMEDGSVFRLNQYTDLLVLQLDPQAVRLEIREGEMIARVASDADYRVRTRQGEVTLRAGGLYRVNSAPDGGLEVLARQAPAEFAGERVARSIPGGRRLSVAANGKTVQLGEVEYADSFDTWSAHRDARYTSLTRSRYLPQDVRYGFADLDYHGRWVHLHDHGYGWAPRVQCADWTPFQNGYWRYTQRWGWTWVSHDPWGWLPYHYGFWERDFRFGWVWVPPDMNQGRWAAKDTWSPARVEFSVWNGYVGWWPKGGRHQDAVTYVRLEDFRSGRGIGDGAHGRTAGSTGTRQARGFQPDQTVTANLLRRENAVRETPRVEPTGGEIMTYTRQRTESGVRREEAGQGRSSARMAARIEDEARGVRRMGGAEQLAQNMALAGGGARGASENRGRPSLGGREGRRGSVIGGQSGTEGRSGGSGESGGSGSAGGSARGAGGVSEGSGIGAGPRGGGSAGQRDAAPPDRTGAQGRGGR